MNYIDALLVDDDDVDTMCVQREFKKQNLPIILHTATNGIEALNQLYSATSQGMPKLIIMDIMMPKMNGIEFLKKLRTNTCFANIHIIVLTTSNNDKDKQAVQGLNIAGYFIKQTEFDAFLRQVKYLIAPVSNTFITHGDSMDSADKPR